jgi:hypothetical protein
LRNKEPYPNRGETEAKGPHVEEGRFQKTREASPTKEAANRAEVAQTGPPSPFRAPFAAPFVLDDPKAIYSPPAKSHTRIHSLFGVEEQRREGHHSKEERVGLVV